MKSCKKNPWNIQNATLRIFLIMNLFNSALVKSLKNNSTYWYLTSKAVFLLGVTTLLTCWHFRCFMMKKLWNTLMVLQLTGTGIVACLLTSEILPKLTKKKCFSWHRKLVSMIRDKLIVDTHLNTFLRLLHDGAYHRRLEQGKRLSEQHHGGELVVKFNYIWI